MKEIWFALYHVFDKPFKIYVYVHNISINMPTYIPCYLTSQTVICFFFLTSWSVQLSNMKVKYMHMQKYVILS
jgi:hypothetical protein